MGYLQKTSQALQLFSLVLTDWFVGYWRPCLRGKKSNLVEENARCGLSERTLAAETARRRMEGAPGVDSQDQVWW